MAAERIDTNGRADARVPGVLMPSTQGRDHVREIQNGDRVKDKVTGFEGTVVGVADYISGCRQCCVAPEARGGKFEESHWFDDDRLSVTTEQAVTLTERKRAGGPQSNPAPTR